MKRVFILIGMLSMVFALAGCNSSGAAEGDNSSFPEKDLKIIVHTSSGGPTDLMAREVAKGLEKELGVNVIVENQPGGSGATAMNGVYSSAADGYTLGAMTPSQIGLINGNLKGQYSLDDFSWISRSQIDPYVLVANSESGFEDLEEVVEQLNNGSLTVGGYGAQGSAHNISWNIFAEAAGVTADWTPYESTGDAVTALLGNHIDLANSNPGQVSQYVEAGDLKILAVNAEERLDDYPEVPTLKELGYDVDTEWVQFRGLFGPSDIPEEVLQKLDEALENVYNSEDYQNYMENAQMITDSMNSEEFNEYIERQNEITEDWYEKLGFE